jgi:hypothetical protein
MFPRDVIQLARQRHPDGVRHRPQPLVRGLGRTVMVMFLDVLVALGTESPRR